MTKRKPDQNLFLENLYREHWKDLVSYAASILPVSLAEDAAQKTFVIAAERIELLVDHPCPVGWLYRTVRNVSMSDRRSYDRYIDYCLPFEDNSNHLSVPHADPAERYDDNAAEMLVAEIFLILTEEEGHILQRIVGEKASHKEVAKEMGIPETACQKRLERIKKKARKYVEKEYGKIF